MKTTLWINGLDLGKGQHMAKAGRKRREGEREPNGRLQRSYSPPEVSPKEAASNRAVAMAARMKMFGLTAEDAADQKAATFIGRLNLAYARGERVVSLSDTQYYAALDHMREYNAYQRATCSRPDYQESPEMWDLSGEPCPIARAKRYERFCIDAIDRWDKRQKVVREHMMETRSPAASEFLRLCVIENYQVWELVAPGRELLNRLITHCEERYKAAA